MSYTEKLDYKIKAISEMIRDAEDAIADPALDGMYKTEIEGHIFKAENAMRKLKMELGCAGRYLTAAKNLAKCKETN